MISILHDDNTLTSVCIIIILFLIIFYILGKGLGKNEDGISQAIKPTLKFDNAGIGYKETPTEHWWQVQFDNAAKNIKVESHEGCVSLSVVDNNQTIASKKSERNKPYQKSFLNAGVLKEVSNDSSLPQSLCGTSVKSEKKEADLVYNQLTDEQLYTACGGRTAHKTARHNLPLSGKLERIAQQDSIFLGASTSNTSQCNIDKINYNKGTVDFNDSWYEHKPTDFFKEETIDYNLIKNLIEGEYEMNNEINELSQEMSTWDLKEDATEVKHKFLKNKRKRYKDLRINTHETEDVYFFNKKQKTSLNTSLKKAVNQVDENAKQKSINEQIVQIAKGCRIMNIKQESGSIYYETKKKNMKQLEEQNKSHYLSQTTSHIKYLKLAAAWTRICKMRTKKPIEYLLVKRSLDVNKHMDLPSNIEKCIIEHPYLKNVFHDFYFMTIGKLDLKKSKRIAFRERY